MLGVMSSQKFTSFSFEGDISFRVGSQTNGFAANTLTIAVDGQNIFHIDNLLMETILDLEELRLERHNTEGFQLDWNKTWKVSSVFPSFFDGITPFPSVLV